MKKSIVPLLAAIAVVGTLYILLDSRSPRTQTDVAVAQGNGADSTQEQEPGQASEKTKHRVTPQMWERSAAWTKAPAPEISAQADDGTVYSLADMTNGKPAVVIFIKDKCPCSAAADPYFTQLHLAYKDQVNFFGVIDGGAETAKGWKDLHKTPYPILLDPDLIMVKDYQVSNSAYVALINSNGQIERLWPGYSESMLKEMNRQIASLGGVAAPDLRFTDAPEEPFSGCPFDTGL